MFLSHLVKSVLLVVSITSAANAYLIPGGSAHDQQHPGQYQPGIGGEGEGWVDPGSGLDPNPYQPGYPNQPSHSDRDTRSVWVQRQVTNERLDLRALAGLDSWYRGWEVVNVQVNLRGNRVGRNVVQLMADGRIIATEVSQGYQVNLTPQNRAILGTTIRSLHLLVNGSVYVDSIQVDLSNSQGSPQLPLPHEPPPYPGNPGYPGQPGYGQQRVDINIYRNLYGNDRIDLSQFIDLGRYQGMAIEQVIVQGSAGYNSSFLNVIVNGNNMGQAAFTGNYSQQQSIWLSRRPVIGQGAESVVLYSSGQMTVERVTLVLSY